MADEKVLHAIITEAGYNADLILIKANSPDLKQELRSRTQEARDTGICGVPSYRIFRRNSGDRDWKLVSDIIWGQDDLVVVEDIISGWDGQSSVQETKIYQKESPRL
jgi:2-hydroxychromene-2-carboxylate isomerase